MAKPKVVHGVPSLCENCQHFAGDANSQSAPCRKHAPVAMFIGMDETGPVIVSAWPPVRPNNWCGEHEMVSLIQTVN